VEHKNGPVTKKLMRIFGIREGRASGKPAQTLDDDVGLVGGGAILPHLDIPKKGAKMSESKVVQKRRKSTFMGGAEWDRYKRQLQKTMGGKSLQNLAGESPDAFRRMSAR